MAFGDGTATLGSKLLELRVKQGDNNLGRSQMRSVNRGLGSLNRHKIDTMALLGSADGYNKLKFAENGRETGFVVMAKPDFVLNPSGDFACDSPTTTRSSAVIKFVKKTIRTSFSIDFLDHNDDEIKRLQQIQANFNRVDELFAQQKNADCLAHFLTHKAVETAVDPSISRFNVSFDATNDQIQVPIANEFTDYFASITPVQKTHRMYRPVNIVSDLGSEYVAERLSQQNAVKTYLSTEGTDTVRRPFSDGAEIWQFSDKTFLSDDTIDAGVGAKARMHISPVGSFGIVPYIEPIFRSPLASVKDENNRELSTLPASMSPSTGEEIMFKYYNECSVTGGSLNRTEYFDCYQSYYLIEEWNPDAANDSFGIFDQVLLES